MQPGSAIPHDPSSNEAIESKTDSLESVQPPTIHEPSSTTAKGLKFSAVALVQPNGGGVGGGGAGEGEGGGAGRIDGGGDGACVTGVAG